MELLFANCMKEIPEAAVREKGKKISDDLLCAVEFYRYKDNEKTEDAKRVSEWTIKLPARKLTDNAE